MNISTLTIALTSLLLLALPLTSGKVHGDEPKTPQQWLAQFTKSQDEKNWKSYIRPVGDETWQTRMLAMHALAKGGKDSIAPLVGALESDDVQTRILAAQTLGYLSPNVPTAALKQAIENDRSAAVRLYAIDSLGMQGGGDLRKYFEPRQGKETNRDTQRHMNYAIERKGEAMQKAIGESLINWDPKQIDTAKTGSMAPDFELSTVSGKKIRLSDYRGKKTIVLAFIYGDT